VTELIDKYAGRRRGGSQLISPPGVVAPLDVLSGIGGRPCKPESGSELVSGLLVAEDTFDDFGVLG